MSMIRRTARKTAGLALVLAAISQAASAGAGPPPTPSVPEIDAGSVLSAITLLSGGMMIIADRRRAK